MKSFLFISMALIMLACTENEKVQEDDTTQEEDVPFDYTVSTAYEFKPIELPYYFYLDTIEVYDSVKHVSCTGVLVKSDRTRYQKFNELLYAYILEGMLKEIEAVEFTDTLFDPYHTYYVAPVSFYKDSSVISITHVVDTYTETGNHHNYVYRTFNYSRKMSQPIWYSDYFNLPERSDSARLQELAYNCRQKERCFHWESISDTIDFAFSGEGITFRPDMGWSCNEGLSVIPYDSLKALIY